MAIQDPIIQVSQAITQNELLISIVSAVIILLIGFIVGRIVGKLLLKVLREIEFDKTVKKATGYQHSAAELSSNIASYFIYFITIILALESLGLTPFVLNMIVVVIIVILAISIILAVKDFIPNFAGGYSVRTKGLFKKGDIVKVDTVEGKIVKINLLDTHIETHNGDLILIPNSFFIKNMVIKKAH